MKVVEVRKNAKNKNATTFSMSRYAWTGAGIGLYFGLFFRPQRDPSFPYALVLALLVAVVMTGVYGWRERPSFSKIPAYFGMTYVKVALVLSLLEVRHYALAWGGKTAVVIFSVLMGAATGMWFAYEASRHQAPEATKKKG